MEKLDLQNLHSTIFILKLFHIQNLLKYFHYLHSTIFILKPEKYKQYDSPNGIYILQYLY